MNNDKNAIVLFSGGEDSALTALKLANRGFNVNLINFKTAHTLYSKENSIKLCAQALEIIPNIQYIGNLNNVVAESYINKVIKTIDIGNLPQSLTISQLDCLACRCAMYCQIILYALKHNIKYVADGARKDQLFAIEQPEMIELFKEKFAQYGITFMAPMLNYNRSKFDQTTDLLQETFFYKNANVFIPYEDKCVLGVKMLQPLSQNTIEECTVFFENIVSPVMDDYIQKYNDFKIETFEGPLEFL